ncbi:MAG: hypothetical protein ACO1OC_09660 [Tuberibacillus sp.]
MKTCKGEDGLTLLETMVTLLVIVVCLTILGPILSRVSAERHAIVQTETALSLLNNQLTQWTAGRSNLPAESKQNQTVYSFNWTAVDSRTIQLCINWNNSAGRNQRICAKAKR